ncbi:hypothetical protein AB0K00_21815 [Dactylosporangium sp. NPDC049525]|uniref:hypothetical protein n=1 Tax=Dactylosporangium sp. NPDC049525 TaxID=3154730 RepID=UPI003435F81D
MTGRPRHHSAPAQHLTGPSLRLALGLAECLLPTTTYDGIPAVDPRDARFILSGQLGVWDRWRDGLSPEHRHMIDRLLALRPRRLATEGGFRVSLEVHLRNGRSPRYDPLGDLLQVTDGIPVAQLLTTALADLEAAASPPAAPPVAQPGRTYNSSVFLTGAGREEYRRNTYQIPEVPPAAAQPSPIPVIDTPAPQQLVLDMIQLRDTARRIDEARAGASFSLFEALQSFTTELRGPDGQPLQRLELVAGPLTLAVAPTGSGKSILMRVAATHLAEQGHIPVLLTPDIESTLALVADIRSDLAALHLDLPVTALMSSRRLIDVAVRRSDDAPGDIGRARWTWEEIGYSCLLPADDGAAWQPGQEPCTDLQEPGEEGRHRCPMIGVCQKWAPWRQAAGPARIIVTNHAYFQQGSLPAPVMVNGQTNGRISAQELLLRRASIIMIDEIDAFQAHAVSRSGRTLVLARRDTQRLLLAKLDEQRQEQVFSRNVPRDLELDFQRVIHRLEFLSERYLAAVVNEFIDPRDPLGPRQARLHLPRRWDNLLACRLCGLDELEERPSDEQLDHFSSLFTVVDPATLPDGWTALRQQLRLVVSDHPDADRIDQRRQDVIDALGKLPDVTVADPLQTAHLLLRRAFLGELQQGLAELERLLPLMRDSGMRLADDVEAALDRGSAWQATPEGPIGRAVFGFAVTGDQNDPSERQLNAEIISGDPHAYTAELGMTTAPALTGAPRIVLGMSATAYLPGAPTIHVHTDVACYYPDDATAGTGKLAVSNAAVNDATNRGITVSGAARNRKAQLLADIGAALWEQMLEPRLTNLRQHPQRRDRARVLLVTNSYEQGVELCRGLIRGGAHRARIAVAVPTDGPRDLQIPDDVLALPATRLSTFPDTGRDVLISPFARVARGLNIVVGRRSALDSIWVCVRPIKLIDEPAALVAHSGAHARRNRHPAVDPRRELDARHDLAGKHLEKINRSNPAFGRLPADVRTAIFADVLADLIQLAGRARRGGTDTTLYLVDNAFHRGGAAPGSDFVSLVRALHRHWQDTVALDQVKAIYGTTLDAFLDFAGLTDRTR